MATQYNFDILQGSTFSTTVTGLFSSGAAVNLNAYGITAGAMAKQGCSGYLFSFTTGVVSASAGTFTLNIPATGTAALYAGRYVYTVNAISGLDTQQILNGRGYIHPQSI